MTHFQRKFSFLFVIIALFLFIGAVFGQSPRAQANIFESVWEKVSVYFGNLEEEGDFLKDSSFSQPDTSSLTVELYKPTLDYEEAVIRAVEKSAPAVVSIVVSKDVKVLEECFYDPLSDLPSDVRKFFGEGFTFRQQCDTGKTKREEIGGGTGFIVSSDGLIVTNKHVVLETGAAYTVFTNDGKKYDARVLARDQSKDLAVLKIDGQNFPILSLGDSDSVKLGQTAIAIGNALGEFRNTVSAGVISGLARTVVASGGSGFRETIEGVFQTDAAINPGNSGGPLLNLKGEVIAINTAIASGAQNIGFAIPINQAKRAIESVKQTGRIVTAYLGIRYITLTEQIAQDENIPLSEGALIQPSDDGPAVIPNSPAAKAGVLVGDIITEVNGIKVSEARTLSSLVQEHSVGERITLRVFRNGQYIQLTVLLEERP